MDKKQLTVRKSLPSQNNRSCKKSQKSYKCILIRERTFENVKSTRIWWNCIFAGTSYLLTDAVNKVNVYTTSFSSRKTVTFSKFKHLKTIDIFKRQASILIKPITKLFKISISFGANDGKIARVIPFYRKTSYENWNIFMIIWACRFNIIKICC